MSANMIGTSRKLLPVSELRRLRTGSYEERIEHVYQVLESHYGPGVDLIATRDDCAVVRTPEGYYRVRVEGGKTHVIGSLDVWDYGPESAYAAVESAAGGIAERVIRGDTRAAVQLLVETIGGMGAVPAVAPGVSFEVVRLESYLKRPALWRRFLESRRREFEDFLGEELRELREGRLISDLSQLYDGSIESEDTESCEGEVESQLAVVGARLEALQSEVVGALKTAEHELRQEQKEGASIGSFLAFARDLRDDLRETRRRSDDALVTVDGIRSRGKLCDVLVEELYDREVAGRFMAVAARRLSEAD